MSTIDSRQDAIYKYTHIQCRPLDVTGRGLLARPRTRVCYSSEFGFFNYIINTCIFLLFYIH